MNKYLHATHNQRKTNHNEMHRVKEPVSKLHLKLKIDTRLFACCAEFYGRREGAGRRKERMG
jgi:hypothetical protein